MDDRARLVALLQPGNLKQTHRASRSVPCGSRRRRSRGFAGSAPASPIPGHRPGQRRTCPSIPGGRDRVRHRRLRSPAPHRRSRAPLRAAPGRGAGGQCRSGRPCRAPRLRRSAGRRAVPVRACGSGRRRFPRPCRRAPACGRVRRGNGRVARDGVSPVPAS
ncbi:hypothetical protein ebA3395 [Aromatoleum aromaticum EbN1]|uniref:Uncharacterized protein n=1 Tax=Aromatoleum aromaticum (strain DSM 19018 / LMG 30748 / EbN1) TaxID=76114 RepID=Q5P3R9_AROAE|nr:hypothetical protein ebA3395 [Aromatoleum aromaticum EbN1]